MHRLNDDCLRYIFELLTPKEWANISQVCTRWKNVTMDLWEKLQNLELENRCYNIKKLQLLNRDEVVAILQHMGPLVTDLKLKGYAYSNLKYGNELKMQIGQFVYKLNELNAEDAVQELSKFCSNINSLQVKQNYFENYESLRELLQSNRNLKKLNVSYCHLVEILIHLAKPVEELIMSDTCELLESFSEGHDSTEQYKSFFCELISFEYNGRFIPFLIEIFENMKKLKKLAMNIDFDYDIYKPIDLLPNLGAIEEIYITAGLLPVSKNVLIQMATKCTKLRIIKMKIYANKIAGNILTAILCIPNLEIVHLHPVKEMPCVLYPVSQNLRDLKIHFKAEKEINLEYLSLAMDKMEMLLDLYISGLQEEMSVAFTQKVITLAISLNKIPVICSDRMKLEIHQRNSDELNEVKSKMNILIKRQDKSYVNKIRKFIETELTNCKLVEIDLPDSKWNFKNLPDSEISPGCWESESDSDSEFVSDFLSSDSDS